MKKVNLKNDRSQDRIPVSYRTNVWSYKGMNSFGGNRNQDSELHPTVKPVAMIADAIKDVSSRNGIVLDLFGGSGSTLIAADKTGRRAFLCELDPLYCDRIIRRWQLAAKDEAILEATSQSFEEVRKERRRDAGPLPQIDHPGAKLGPASEASA